MFPSRGSWARIPPLRAPTQGNLGPTRGNCSTRGILALIEENHELLLEFAADPETVLELVHRDDLTQALNAFVENHDARWVPLRPDALSTGMPRLERWKLIVNESVEPDL